MPPLEPDPANPPCRLLTEEVAESVTGLDLAFDGDVITASSGAGVRTRVGPVRRASSCR
jgi:hypothetical protein